MQWNFFARNLLMFTKAGPFVVGKPFQPSQLFVGKAKALP